MGCRLVHAGVDLTTMVLSWAQLGYLVMTMDDSGRVFLHKRMEMGNERSAFENHYFRNLFRKQATVDGTGYHYARLCCKASTEVPNARGDFRSSSGNPRLMRWLCMAVGAVSAGAAGGALTDSFVVRILLTVLFAAMGAAASWSIHEGCKCFHLRNKLPLYIALGALGMWVLLSIVAGQWQIMLLGVIVQILGGLTNAYGGRRSELGRQTASEILGFRNYLKTVSREELHRILRVNPDYYYEMVPYAVALGVDKAFAGRFGKMNVGQCPYIFAGAESTMRAEQWQVLMRRVLANMSTQPEQSRMEKVLSFLKQIRQ
jgi:hypothetical protein